jgi:hypothetical protein
MMKTTVGAGAIGAGAASGYGSGSDQMMRLSRDFGTLFLILLDKFEGRNRAEAGLFFILMTFHA